MLISKRKGKWTMTFLKNRSRDAVGGPRYKDADAFPRIAVIFLRLHSNRTTHLFLPAPFEAGYFFRFLRSCLPVMHWALRSTKRSPRACAVTLVDRNPAMYPLKH
ncbi:uncharacterized protein LOC143265198 [Megachile rotundata]|uniref:uncharacterized protein LOC143265198 n=1 Tax=Megachile rotundata TaxID=143995 RepID=UPI003FD43D99